MSQEILLINKYDFILKWYKKMKVFVINPVTLLFLSKRRVVFNIFLLVITLFALQEIPKNAMIQYFMGENSSLFKLLWLPYIILWLFDFRYLSKLYLLISEMEARLQMKRSKSSTQNQVVIVSATLHLNKQMIQTLTNYSRKCKIHIVRLLQITKSYKIENEIELFKADLKFQIPSMTNNLAKEYMTSFSGVKNDEVGSGTLATTELMEFSSMDPRVIEIIRLSRSALLSPELCFRVMLNYKYLTYRFELNSFEKDLLALLLPINHSGIEIRTKSDLKLELAKTIRDNEENLPVFQGVKLEDIELLMQKIKAYF